MTRAETTPSAGQRRTAARDAYRASLAGGVPLTGAELGRRFGLSPRWGRNRVAEAHAEAITSGNGIQAATGHARERRTSDRGRGPDTGPETVQSDGQARGAESASTRSNGGEPRSGGRAASERARTKRRQR